MSGQIITQVSSSLDNSRIGHIVTTCKVEKWLIVELYIWSFSPIVVSLLFFTITMVVKFLVSKLSTRKIRIEVVWITTLRTFLLFMGTRGFSWKYFSCFSENFDFDNFWQNICYFYGWENCRKFHPVILFKK